MGTHRGDIRESNLSIKYHVDLGRHATSESNKGKRRERAWTNPTFHFITQLLFEAIKGLEDVVEVIPRKIIQKDLVFWRFMV